LVAALGAWITTMVPIASSNQSFVRPDGVYGRIQWWACRAQQVQPTVD